MSKALIWVAVAVGAIVLAAVLLFPARQTPAPIEGGAPTPQDQSTVRITSAGFEPAMITIKKGESATWINESGRDVWPASATHPTHNLYPVGGGCIGSAFDACRGLKTGERYTFKFDEAGSWRYHNHLNPSMTGTVVVVE